VNYYPVSRDLATHNPGMPRLIFFVLCLSFLSWSASARVGMALLLLCGVLLSAYLVVLAWKTWTGPEERRGPLR